MNWQTIASALSGGLAGAVDGAGFDPTTATTPSLSTAFGTAGTAQGVPVYGAPGYPQSSSGLASSSGGFNMTDMLIVGGLLVAVLVLPKLLRR